VTKNYYNNSTSTSTQHQHQNNNNNIINTTTKQNTAPTQLRNTQDQYYKQNDNKIMTQRTTTNLINNKNVISK